MSSDTPIEASNVDFDEKLTTGMDTLTVPTQSHSEPLESSVGSTRDETPDKSSTGDEASLVTHAVRQEYLEKKKKETNQVKGIGRAVLKLLRTLEIYFETHEIEDIDDLSVDGDPFEIPSESLNLDTPGPDVSGASANVATDLQGKDVLQPLGQNEAKDQSPRPKFKAEVYRYTRDKDSGGWNPKLEDTFEGKLPVVVDESGEPTSEVDSTFEVVTMYATLKRSNDTLAFAAMKEPEFKVHAHLETYLTIHSASIINAIRKIVKYYPMISYRHESPLILIQPFCLLLHYKDELTELRDELVTNASGTSSTDDVQTDASVEASHLTPLINFLSEGYDRAIAKERSRWQNARPMCTFEWLWLLFKPGTVAVAWSDDVPVAYTIQSHSKDTKPDKSGRVKAPELHHRPLKFTKWARPLILKMWALDFDGKIVGRQQKTVIIPPFEGEKFLDNLPIIPISHWKDPQNQVTRKDLEERLIKRGKEFFRLTKRTYCEYSGKAMS